MPTVRVPPYFVARLRMLSKGRQKYIIRRLQMFQCRPTDPQLRLRNLNCMPGHVIINSIRGDRIIMKRVDDSTYVAEDCGGHDILDEWDRMAVMKQDGEAKH